MKAIDESGKSAECTVRINVTDKNRFSPEFQELEYSFDISEDVGNGASIGQVKVSHFYS